MDIRSATCLAADYEYHYKPINAFHEYVMTNPVVHYTPYHFVSILKKIIYNVTKTTNSSIILYSTKNKSLINANSNTKLKAKNSIVA